MTSVIAELARSRALEAERRREEADLAADLARNLLVRAPTQAALRESARRVADASGIDSAAIELGAVAGDQRRRAVPLLGPDGDAVATLLVPANLPPRPPSASSRTSRRRWAP